MMTIKDALSRPTISVPDAGALFFGLGRYAAYEAAKRGDIPTVKIGGRIMVPVVPLAERLGLRVNIGGERSMSDTVDRLLKAREVADFLQISIPTLYRRVKDQTLPKPVKLGGASRWSRSEILGAVEAAAERRAA